MEERQEPYKVELIKDLPEDAEISFYKEGDFIDLCWTSYAINRCSQSNKARERCWRILENEKNKMLQRIYGTSFPKQLLDEYIERLEEAKKRS